MEISKCRNCGTPINPKMRRQDFCNIGCYDAFTDWMEFTDSITIGIEKEKPAEQEETA